MKTIGYADRCNPSVIHEYAPKKTLINWQCTKNERITQALQELKRMGNINIYYLNGNKYRKICTRGM